MLEEGGADQNIGIQKIKQRRLEEIEVICHPGIVKWPFFIKRREDPLMKQEFNLKLKLRAQEIFFRRWIMRLL